MKVVLIVFGLPDTNVPVWEVIPKCNVMVNALKGFKMKLPKGVRVWVDSGGFQILMKGLRINVVSLIRIYRNLDADIYMSLDIPPQRLGVNDKELLKANLSNFEFLYEKLDDKIVVPIVHASLHPDAIVEFIDIISKTYGCKYLACGGAVPLVLSKWGRGSKLYAILAMTLVRKMFRGWLHALGVGGSNVMKVLISILNFDSFDSTAWRIKAAYGKVMVPGVGERYVGTRGIRFGKTHLSENEYEILIKFLRSTGFPYANKVNELLQTFVGRAIINAWVLAYSRVDDSNTYSRTKFKWLFTKAKEINELSNDEIREMMNRILSSEGGRFTQAIEAM